MNYYRLSMILLGTAIAVPNIAFLLMFHPPARRVVWLGRALRIKSSALLVGGIRITWLYWSVDAAGSGISSSDKFISLALTSYVAIAAWAFFAGFLLYRHGKRGALDW